jgi:hypothetical protein
MREVSYQLTPEGLAAYQYASRDRTLRVAPGGWWEQAAVRALVLIAATVICAWLADTAIAVLYERPMELPEFVLGTFVGCAVMLALVWVIALDQRRRLPRPDGHTLSPQTLRLTEQGIAVTSRSNDVLHYWPAIEEISQARGLVILWIEPGAGIAIPTDAFATADARAEFIREAEALRAAVSKPG